MRQIILIMVATMVIISAMMLYLFSQLEKNARQSLKERVEIALAIDAQHLTDFVHDYSFWDEAHQHQIREQDERWIEENTGLYLFEKYNFNLVLAVTGEHNVLVRVIDGKLQQPANAPGLTGILQKIFAGNVSINTRHDEFITHVEINDDVYVLSAGRFFDEDTKQPTSDGSYFILGKRIDQTYLNGISETFRLPELNLVTDAGALPACCSYVFSDIEGRRLTGMTWPEVSMKNYLAQVAIFLLILTVILVLLLKLILSENRRVQNEVFNRAKKQSGTDPLTGLANHQQFIERLKQEFHRSQRTDDSLSLLLLGIEKTEKQKDHPDKQIDSLVLSEVADRLKSQLRDFDLLARYEDSFFAIMLPGTGQQEALDTANRVVNFVENMEVYIGSQGSVRISPHIGVVTRVESDSLDKLLIRLKKTIQQAKRPGASGVQSDV